MATGEQLSTAHGSEVQYEARKSDETHTVVAMGISNLRRGWEAEMVCTISAFK
jgi:hypothetical protein